MALHSAIAQGKDKETINALLKSCDKDQPGEGDQTPLHEVCATTANTHAGKSIIEQPPCVGLFYCFVAHAPRTMRLCCLLFRHRKRATSTQRRYC